MTKCVENLIALLGHANTVGEQFNWTEIECNLGLTLPNDFKELVEVFPPGFFQGYVRLIRPGDHSQPMSTHLGYYVHRLDDMRRWREEDPARFPWPIFPENGGVLPWGRSRRSDLFFWLTEGEDPNAWPLILADREFEFSFAVESTVCEFLADVVKEKFDGSRFGADPTVRGPWFDLANEKEVREPTTRPDENYWISRGGGGSASGNQLDSLVGLLGKPVGEPEKVSWNQVEERLGVQLPSDYRNFIDSYGPGVLSGLRVVSPDVHRDASMFNLLKEKRGLLVNHPLYGDLIPPVHPETTGLIPWGYMDDGWFCGWAPSGSDPEQWGIVLVDPALGHFYYPSLSFSGFLVKYMESDFDSLVGRTPGSPRSTVFDRDDY